jgi:hypothetical protein
MTKVKVKSNLQCKKCGESFRKNDKVVVITEQTVRSIVDFAENEIGTAFKDGSHWGYMHLKCFETKGAEMLRKAVFMAVKAHRGQVEKSGGAYIDHPLRVHDLLIDEDDVTRVTGILHDVVEDSDVTLEEVRREFSDEVADAVDAVTRRKDETYFEFIARAKLHPVGRKVKIADLKDHLRPGHEKYIPESLIKRYQKAWAVMHSV